MKQQSYTVKNDCLKLNPGKILDIVIKRKKISEPYLCWFKDLCFVLFHHCPHSSVMASEHPNGIGLKLQSRDSVGWGQNLVFYVPQSTGSLRIIGEILEGCNQLQNIHRAKQFLNTYIIESDPKATLDVCSLLNNVGFITVLKDLTFSHPRFLCTLEKALCYSSRSLW